MLKYSVEEIVASSKLFESLTQEEKDLLIQKSTILQYKKGEAICKQGAFANHIMLVTNGLVKTYLEGQNDKNLIISFINPINWIELVSIYDEIFSLSVAAVKDSNIMFIEKKAFVEIINRNPAFSNQIIQVLTLSKKHYFKKIISLGNKQLHGRFADALLYLSNVVAQSNIIDLSITRKEIGEYAGISTESAIRLLSELNHDGIIELDGKIITILKENLLTKLSQIG
ncbi:MAG: Crp/Fnr family transcriptional regulator [Bacteroidales bacterium]|jgi:CRP/FNR family transcriptional regulator|nr:Crp/Fnr family transcriptional regulator [Bacteroidales bacterium]